MFSWKKIHAIAALPLLSCVTRERLFMFSRVEIDSMKNFELVILNCFFLLWDRGCLTWGLDRGALVSAFFCSRGSMSKPGVGRL